MTRNERIDKLYAELAKAETRTEVARIIAEMRSEGVSIPVPKPINGPAGKKSEEAERRASFLLKNVHRCCMVVPYGESSWCYGYIHGVTYDPEDGVCLYTVWLDDGRRIVKRDGGESLKLLDGYKKNYGPRSVEARARDMEEAVQADRQSLKAARAYVGYLTEIDGLGPVRIESVSKSRGKLLYRIITQDGDRLYRYPKPGQRYWRDGETEAVATRYVSRVTKPSDLAAQIRQERAMLDKAEQVVREFTARAELHRQNIEALKKRMADEMADEQ